MVKQGKVEKKPMYFLFAIYGVLFICYVRFACKYNRPSNSVFSGIVLVGSEKNQTSPSIFVI
jgi:hypothetical protein